MLMGYDTFLFIEIIDSIKDRIHFLRESIFNGYKARFYQGVSGKLVMIDISEEFIADDAGKGYLFQLGLPDLVPSLFPTPINLNDHTIDHYCSIETDKLLQVKFHDKEDVLIGRIVSYEVIPSPYPINDKLIGRFKIVADIEEYKKDCSLNYVKDFDEINLTKDKILEIINLS